MHISWEEEASYPLEVVYSIICGQCKDLHKKEIENYGSLLVLWTTNHFGILEFLESGKCTSCLSKDQDLEKSSSVQLHQKHLLQEVHGRVWTSPGAESKSKWAGLMQGKNKSYSVKCLIEDLNGQTKSMQGAPYKEKTQRAFLKF